MRNVAKKSIVIFILVAAMVLAFSSVAFAAEPQYIYYENENGEIVRASYQNAVDNLPDDATLRDAIRAALRSAIEGFRDVWVEDQSGPVIDYGTAAADDGLTYPEAFADLATYETTKPTPVKELVIDPDTGEAVEWPFSRVVSVGPLDDIEVDYGTSLNAVKGKLPVASDLVVTLADESTAPALAVYWDGGEPVYNRNIAQTYSFKGEIVMPDGIANPGNVKAKVNVIVTDDSTFIVSVGSLADIEVDYGTSLNAVKAELPVAGDVILTLSDDTTAPAEAVYWDEGSPNYDGTIARSYTFVGEIAPPAGITNPYNRLAQVKVIVGEEPTYTVTFDLTPADAGVEVKDKNDNVIVAEEDDTYELTNGEYSYTVSEVGYVSEEDDFTVAGVDKTISVTLTAE